MPAILFFTTSELDKMVQPELDDLGKAKYKKSVIDDAAFQIETRYRHEGFVRARVDYRFDQTVTPNQIVFNISEGKRVMVRSLSIRGNSFFDTDRLLAATPEISASLKKGRPFPLVQDELAALGNDIRSLYLSDGFIDVHLTGPEYTYTADGTAAAILFRVEEGPRYTIGEIHFAGEWGGKICR